ncbi:hypothetical protein ACWD6I_23815 [Streptomyces sp. NPDC002454]
MYGTPPQQPPRPANGSLIALRVLFVTVAVGSCGLLGWTALLRVAVVTRARRDWQYFSLALAVLLVGFAMVAADRTENLDTWHGNVGMAVLLLSGLACAGYFLYADIRHFRTVPGPWPAAHPPRPVPPAAPTAGYGYPPTAHPGPPAAPHSVTHPAAPAPPYPGPGPVPAPPAHSPSPPPVPPPAPGRIDQVRAELDELSDYLRRQEPDHGDPRGRGGDAW